jgi:hypothetical protein
MPELGRAIEQAEETGRTGESTLRLRCGWTAVAISKVHHRLSCAGPPLGADDLDAAVAVVLRGAAFGCAGGALAFRGGRLCGGTWRQADPVGGRGSDRVVSWRADGEGSRTAWSAVPRLVCGSGLAEWSGFSGCLCEGMRRVGGIRPGPVLLGRSLVSVFVGAGRIVAVGVGAPRVC